MRCNYLKTFFFCRCSCLAQHTGTIRVKCLVQWTLNYFSPSKLGDSNQQPFSYWPNTLNPPGYLPPLLPSWTTQKVPNRWNDTTNLCICVQFACTACVCQCTFSNNSNSHPYLFKSNLMFIALSRFTS